MRLLERVWPDWRSVAEALSSSDLPPTEQGLRALRQRQRNAPSLPELVNRKVAASQLADHSKAHLTAAHQALLSDVRLTTDALIRIRPSVGMALARGGQEVDACFIADLQGALALSERAMQCGSQLVGVPPRVLMTVENLGAFVELPKPPEVALVYCPGWDIAGSLAVLKSTPARRLMHFGDLDPNGIRIFRALQGHVSTLELWVPKIWQELWEDTPEMKTTWPSDLPLSDLPPWVRALAASGRWAEQEKVVLNPHVHMELQRMAAS
ncbi:MAG: hypothetical protein H6741_00750 [Alphaproteobacteria bacterium]|nr:hypothetical protein [Alphaproteobacteria bacterium]MCB9791230.1 hypothetical protein [Alphaproteobacteria bacterium]